MGGCGGTILGIVRDFKRGDKDGHPDFETFMGGGEKGIVNTQLGTDSSRSTSTAPTCSRPPRPISISGTATWKA